MDIAWYRDLIIIVAGAIGILLLLVVGILALAIYQRIKAVGKSVDKLSDSLQEVIGSIKATTDSVASLSNLACTEMSEPLMRTAGIIQVVSKTLDAMLGIFRRR